MPSLTMSGDLDCLDQVEQFVKEVAQEAGLDAKAIYKLHLAVDEVVTNIVTYGYAASGLQGDITLSTSLSEEALTLTVEDSAPFYDPFKKAAPAINLPAEQRAIGGLGIYLAVRSVDKFYYERVAGKNHSVFIVLLNQLPD